MNRSPIQISYSSRQFSLAPVDLPLPSAPTYIRYRQTQRNVEFGDPVISKQVDKETSPLYRSYPICPMFVDVLCGYQLS